MINTLHVALVEMEIKHTKRALEKKLLLVFCANFCGYYFLIVFDCIFKEEKKKLWSYNN